MLMTTTFFTYADALVKRKRKAGKYSTADLYRASSNWLLRFWGTDELSFDAITPGMIDRFYDWLLALGHLKTNSVNSYLSSFRAIYHTAVREELAPADRLSPFAHLNLRQEETAKRALRIQTMEEIARMDLSAEPELQAAKDFALFSFLACGMPFIDLAHLTRDNIVDNELVYNRCKTGVLVRVGITPNGYSINMHCPTAAIFFLFCPKRRKANGYMRPINRLCTITTVVWWRLDRAFPSRSASPRTSFGIPGRRQLCTTTHR